jgi:adenosylcobyric acid synthase
VHGVFDTDEVASALVHALAREKGVDPALLGAVSGEAHKQQQYDLLADTIRRHMDMQAIDRIIKEGI